MKTIGVVTVARSDWGILRPVLERMDQTADLNAWVIAAGMHLAPTFGQTVQDIREEGFTVEVTVEMTLASDSPAAIGKSLGLGVIGFSQVFERQRPTCSCSPATASRCTLPRWPPCRTRYQSHTFMAAS